MTVAPAEPELDVSILVPFLDEERFLPVCVPAMRAQAFDGEIELLFIDGRSTDGSRAFLEALAREDPRIRILDNPARRTAAGLNVGLRAARGRFVVRMDAHTVYPPQYVARGVERLRAGGVDWVTGPQVPRGDGPWSRRVALALASWGGRGESDKWPGADAQAAPSGEFELRTSVFTGVWERSTLDELGGWDEGWPVNQDSEMAARVLARGGRIVCRRDMAADYVPRDSLRGLGRQYGRYGYFRAKSFLRHPSSLPRSRWLPVGVLLGLVGSLSRRRAVRLPSLGLCGAYAAAVAAMTARAARREGGEAAYLPLVFAVMHLSWAGGFLLGLARNVVGLRGLRREPAPLRRDSGPRSTAP